MTEEKMAEEYSKSVCAWIEDREPLDERDIQQAFLAGLGAGRPKWHDLRKDPNDLPESYMSVVNQDGENVMYDYYCKSWRYDDADEDFCDAPIAWCEIPKYTEE